MVLELINKLLVVLFFMSCLAALRHMYYFTQAFFSSTEEQPVKYRLSSSSLLYLCVAIAYILSVFFTGITIN